MKTITVRKADFDNYDYVLVPCGYDVIIEGYARYDWFYRYHKDKSDVYLRLIGDGISGFTKLGLSSDMIPLEEARIKKPNDKKARLLSAIKNLKDVDVTIV
jgi:hypothetical protein